MSDVVVVGAGLAGLVAALRLRQAGAEVTLVTKGLGGLQLSQGTVDVLGYTPDRVVQPYVALPGYVAAHPAHPYATIGVDAVRAGVGYLRETLPDLLAGDGETNVLLPTAVGALRPTLLAQPSMLAPLTDGTKVVVVGLAQLKDFQPELVAGNLARATLPGGGRLTARAARVDLPARSGEADSSALRYAQALDDRSYRARFVAVVKQAIEPGETVLLPAVLGLNDPGVAAAISEGLGAPVVEVALVPPSVPGMRLNQALTQRVKDARVRLVLGSKVIGHETDGDRLTSLTVGTTGHPRQFAADRFVLAPGGFESGALELDSYGIVRETTLGLPVHGVIDDLIHGDYWGPDQPLFRCGVAVDEQMRPQRLEGGPVLTNLHAAGGLLAGATRWAEKSGEGIALGSAMRATDAILEETR